MNHTMHTSLDQAFNQVNCATNIYMNLETDMREMVEAEGLKMSKRLLTPHATAPFRIERIVTTPEWINKKLNATDLSVYNALHAITITGANLPMHQTGQTTAGAYILFDYKYHEFNPREELKFLLEYGTPEIKKRYRLFALFADDSTAAIKKEALDIPSFEADINSTGIPLAADLSDKITKELIPFYQRAFARIEEAKAEIETYKQASPHSDN